MEFTEVERERLVKLEALRAKGVDPYPPRAQFIAERVMAADAVKLAEKLRIENEELRNGEPNPSQISNLNSQFIAVIGRIVASRRRTIRSRMIVNA